MNTRKCIILDIDGTLLKHRESFEITTKSTYLLKGVLQRISEWHRKGYKIVLLTGRKEGLRQYTIQELYNFGISYDDLIMDAGNGCRVLINDSKPDGHITARSYSIIRDEGIGEIDE